jgi:Acetyltransferases
MFDTLKTLLPDFSLDLLSYNNYLKYIDVFYSNNDYYMLTDGRLANENDCLETIYYCPESFPSKNVYCVGFCINGVAIGIMSYLVNYPEYNVLWIGLLLIHSEAQRKKYGSQIINAIVAAAKIKSYSLIKLSVQNNNYLGVEFWVKNRFKIINETNDSHNNNDLKMLTMELCIK